MAANLRNLLDDKEPEVAFTAAMTLWKMNDKSGEDILMAVVDGDRSAGPTMVHGTEHKIDKDLHNPEMLARMGVMQGASMFLGPFGYGITAFEFIHQSGGDLTRVAAIEQISRRRRSRSTRNCWPRWRTRTRQCARRRPRRWPSIATKLRRWRSTRCLRTRSIRCG